MRAVPERLTAAGQNQEASRPGAAGVCKRPARTVSAGSPSLLSSVNVSLLFFSFFFSIAVQETSRRGLAWAGLLLSLELSLSVRVSFVHAVRDKPPDAGM